MDSKKYLRDEELKKLLAYLRKNERYPRRYFMVRISAAMGLRMTEARHLRIEDFRQLADEQIVAVHVAKRHDQKRSGYTGREVVKQKVGRKLKSEFLRFFRWARINPSKDSGWLFPAKDTTEPADRFWVHDWFTRACEACGIGRKTYHCLRHYRGYKVQAAKHDPITTQRALRLKDTKTVLIYTQPTPDEERQLADELDIDI